VARGYAGHSDNTSDATTTTHVRASLHEVATALATLTGEVHPLMHAEDRTDKFWTASAISQAAD
jgi:integrase/recombinase XerC